MHIRQHASKENLRIQAEERQFITVDPSLPNVRQLVQDHSKERLRHVGGALSERHHSIGYDNKLIHPPIREIVNAVPDFSNQGLMPNYN